MQETDHEQLASGTCTFGAGRLLPLIEALKKESDGVRSARDIEHIHRMRVASRRLRAALPLFAGCFSEKKFRDWMREIQKVTRALGEARDMDVQIAFLEGYLKKITKAGRLASAGAETAMNHDPQAAIRSLLSRLQQRRHNIQQHVISSLDELETSGAIGEMQLVISSLVPVSGRGHRRPSFWGIPPVAAGRINDRLDALFSYEPWIRDPEAITEHHAMRIAAKKLRYTLEVYAPLYRLGLKKPIDRVKKIQTILGDMHDCDVWIDLVSRTILKERGRAHELPYAPKSGAGTLVALKQFLANREKERAILHRRFIILWEALGRQNLWDELRSNLITGIKTVYCSRVAGKTEEEREAVARLAGEYPPGQEHAHHVTNLALQLFDLLSPLHKLSDRDRTLLEYAGQLHDIGWKHGQEKHRIHSAGMILSDETLPFNFEEREVIALVVQLHGGSTRSHAGGLLPLLSPTDQHRVQMLAAILRVADGLDYRHNSLVRSLRCTVLNDTVICDLTVSGDAGIEKSRALEKGDLFTQVFSHALVIP